jgi:type III pantothenate kinase
VIPELEESICRAWKMSTGGDLRLFDPECAPFTLDYHPPGTLGRDRSAAIWGALDRFGEALGKTFMVADFGTHTVTTVWHEGCVLGGSIAPGIVLQRKSVGGGRLTLVPGMERKEGQAKLDRFHDKGGIGRSTVEGIEAGVVLGSVAAVEGLRKRVEREFGQPVSLVLTGGFACRISPFFSQGVFRNRQLVHYGALKFLSCS